jgi:hypothetical protein
VCCFALSSRGRQGSPDCQQQGALSGTDPILHGSLTLSRASVCFSRSPASQPHPATPGEVRHGALGLLIEICNYVKGIHFMVGKEFNAKRGYDRD